MVIAYTDTTWITAACSRKNEKAEKYPGKECRKRKDGDEQSGRHRDEMIIGKCTLKMKKGLILSGMTVAREGVIGGHGLWRTPAGR
jgi:hypothetical protein